MTTYNITITAPDGAEDITDLVLSANWSRSLGDAAATLQLECINMHNNHAMHSITLTVDGTLRFAGIIKTQDFSFDETIKRSTIEAIDNTDILQRTLVAETYTNQTPKEIITAMSAKYASWLNTSRVQDIGGPIETLSVNYETFASVLSKLAEITGAYWHIDATNTLAFFLDADERASTDYSANRILQGTFDLANEAQELVNRVWIIGARQASPETITQTFVGANNNRYYSLAYVPNYPQVTENGAPKTIALETGETASTDYTYAKKEKVLKRTAGNLPTGVTLQITYNPTIQIIDYFEDTQSVANYGLYEKAIRDKKITDKLAARARGRAELKKKKQIIRSAQWRSLEWNANPGELTRVTMPDFNIDSLWRIDDIDVDFTPERIIATIKAEEVQT